MLRVIDRYILRTLAAPIFFCVYTLILLFLIADLFDHLGDILKNSTPIKVLLQYYLCLIPFAFSQVISWATFLGVIYLFSVFNKNYELIALKASGLDFFSIAKPILFLGFAISVFTFIINDRVVPETYRRAEEIKLSKIKQEQTEVIPEKLINIAFIKRNKQVFIKNMDTKTSLLEDIRIHYLDKNFEVIKKVVAKEAKLTATDEWEFKVVSFYELGADKQIIGEPIFKPAYTMNHEEFDITTEELIQAGQEAKERSIKEVRELIKNFKESGLSFKEELINLYQKATTPWMNFIIVLIILPFLGKSHVRRGMVINILICLLIVFSYHLCNAIVLALGKSNIIPPLLSASLPHLIFGAFGFIYIHRANY